MPWWGVNYRQNETFFYLWKFDLFWQLSYYIAQPVDPVSVYIFEEGGVLFQNCGSDNDAFGDIFFIQMFEF